MSSSSIPATAPRDRDRLREHLDRVAERITANLHDASQTNSVPLAQLRRDEPLASYTTFRIGGPADLYFEATTADELAMAVLAARELDVPYFVLGLGANILIGDKGFPGLVIRNVARHFT